MRNLLIADEKRDTELLAVSVDPKDDLQKMVDRISQEDGKLPDYVFLSDPGHRVIDRYGLLNPDDQRGIPHPTTYVLDKRGVVRWKFTEVNYRIRPTNEMILEALRSMPK
ncbi:MAG: redoxin domain-containing protein [Gemmatimonadetes bacterium]|nr:redoxin domain-containing protein [Gemmatimonadota bacterium]